MIFFYDASICRNQSMKQIIPNLNQAPHYATIVSTAALEALRRPTKCRTMNPIQTLPTARPPASLASASTMLAPTAIPLAIPISPSLFPPHNSTTPSTSPTIPPKSSSPMSAAASAGLLISLAPLFPTTLMIRMELRDKVTEYVEERILALRTTNPGQYDNVSVVRMNSMKYIPNYFEKGQLRKMFFLFPDPHFKKKNHRRRVISPHLLDEYAYVLRVGGMVYMITDVEELGVWMKACLEEHPLFEAVTKEEMAEDPVVELLGTATEEGQKVKRNGGETFTAVYRRIKACRRPGTIESIPN